MIRFAVFHEISPCFDKSKRDISAAALTVQRLNPLKAAGARSAVIFPAGDHLLDLPGIQIFPDFQGTDQRRAHDSFMLKRQRQKDRNPLVRSPLIFAGHIEEDIGPAVSPVPGKTQLCAFGTLRQQKKLHISSLPYDIPNFFPPLVRFLQEKIGRHTDADQLAALHPITPVALLFQRIVESFLRSENIGPAQSADTIQKIHITVVAAFAAFDTSVPRIPDIVHPVLPLLYDWPVKNSAEILLSALFR